ncbi:MAG: ABC transporter ATP-binding protein [Acidimicrobiia bacterium]|nr:ABC transporter ATP-binding protein [Acidimicrobiia bacterium]
MGLEHVTRSFGDIAALSDFTLEVPAGTIAMLLGPNGAGKTTAVRVVTGALPVDYGGVRVLGLDPLTDGEEVRRRCGVVPARPALYDRLTGYHNLRYAADLFEVAEPDSAIGAAAERFDITEALGQRVGGYSTGMRARLALARATLHDPDLLLLDEPTAGLDPESSRAVLDLIREMTRGGKTVLMCTHLLLEAEGIADHVVVMDHGRTLVSGSPQELTRRYWTSATVVIDAEEPGDLDRIATMPGITSYQRDGVALVGLDSLDRVADLVGALVRDGVRVTRVEPRMPSLEELYFAVRRASRGGDATVEPETTEGPTAPQRSGATR